MSMNKELAAAAKGYSTMSEEYLLAELGRRLKTLTDEPNRQASLTVASANVPLPAAALAGPLSDSLKQFGLSFLNRFNKDLFSLMCNPKDPENSKIKDAINTSVDAAAIMLSGLILANFAWLPGIVAIVVGLIIRRFVTSAAGNTYDQVCALWGQEIGVGK